MAARDSSQYHPSYSSRDGDLLLSSSDGVLFNVHSDVLRRASGFFKDMYDMPRSADETPGPLTAKSNTVAAALDIIYPDRGYPTIATVADFQDLQSFGDYYSMPKVGSHIRSLIQAGFRVSPDILGVDPVKLYVLCCRFGLEKEAKLASAQTLRIDVKSGSHDALLEELSCENLLRLTRLHQRRKDAVLNAILLNPRDFFELPKCRVRNSVNMYFGGPENYLHEIPTSWAILTQVIYEAIEKEPLDCVLRDRKFLDHAGLGTLWGTKCDRCVQIVCTKEHFWKSLQDLLDRTPNTV
ncbi:hypothetical protein BD410DRAFT_783570 [Rickenella mellea]|uniref:BTB domain-containing protein n=1 Tax=Rickenella mellea TaxID=50990 RepID=A0A4Y7QI71_9AGAM|nr:hypothetical protein BD410DRAFT_783570 [Rickenella mellea]